MDITFANGTADQQAVVRETLYKFLNLNLDRFPFAMTYEFVTNPSPDPIVHLPLATTASSPGAALTQIRSDFPHFQGQEDIRWAYQAVAHELGHAILHKLPDLSQAEVAALFQTTVDTWEPTGAAWQDRPEEGIAETFKDAFLPQRYRMTTNATNHAIPIWQYAQFRKLFRNGGTAVSGTGARSFPLTIDWTLGADTAIGADIDPNLTEYDFEYVLTDDEKATAAEVLAACFGPGGVGIDAIALIERWGTGSGSHPEGDTFLTGAHIEWIMPDLSLASSQADFAESCTDGIPRAVLYGASPVGPDIPREPGDPTLLPAGTPPMPIGINRLYGHASTPTFPILLGGVVSFRFELTLYLYAFDSTTTDISAETPPQGSSAATDAQRGLRRAQNRIGGRAA